MQKITITSEQDLDEAAHLFLDIIGSRKLVAFNGGMGAGKTTFIAALCRALGVNDAVNSPTFSLVNDYELPSGASIFHFDFYRLDSAAQAFDIGAEDYFDSGNLCLMEWPEKVQEILPEDTLFVDIRVADDGSRTLAIHL